MRDTTEIVKGFKKHFGTNHIFPSDLGSVTGRYDFDIIEFDEWLHRKGYREEKHGSMRNFIRQKYGQEAVQFIESLIKD